MYKQPSIFQPVYLGILGKVLYMDQGIQEWTK